MKSHYEIDSLDQLSKFALELTKQLQAAPDSPHCATVITLAGDLGAGKTTLSQSIGSHLGITEPISSPTFVISKYYDLTNQKWKRFIHIDAYRLEGQNLEPLDFPSLFSDAANIILIEWPQYISSVLPRDHSSLVITHKSDDSRTITIK